MFVRWIDVGAVGYPLDRRWVPVFFTPKEECNAHRCAPGQVFAQNGRHHAAGWRDVGRVSKQTPFGQGTSLGFPGSELRRATREEILAALETDHSQGSEFRPGCQETRDAVYLVALSHVFKNLTITGRIRTRAQRAAKAHADILARWDAVCAAQIGAIKHSLERREQ